MLMPLIFPEFAYSLPAFVTPNPVPAANAHPEILPLPAMSADPEDPGETYTLSALPSVPLYIEFDSNVNPAIVPEPRMNPFVVTSAAVVESQISSA